MSSRPSRDAPVFRRMRPAISPRAAQRRTTPPSSARSRTPTKGSLPRAPVRSLDNRYSTSRVESHLAWVKIAHQAGIGRSAVRQVATDGTGRMDARALAAMIADDKARGCVPVLIVATAGTTNAGMVDPLAACAALAREHGLWLHADAAWGGAVIASDLHRALLAGIELADSVTIDAHQWFATTMGCGMFMTTRHAPILSTVFQVTTGFMPSNAATVDPYVTTAQWSRRFLGVRLFLSLAAAGWEGYAQHIERSIDLDFRPRAQVGRRRLDDRERVRASGAVRRAAGRRCPRPNDCRAGARLRASVGGSGEVRGA